MPIENIPIGILGIINTQNGLKAFLLLFLLFYSVFASMLLRQIQVMGTTISLPPVPFLKFLAIIHVGISLAILFAVVGIY